MQCAIGTKNPETTVIIIYGAHCGKNITVSKLYKNIHNIHIHSANYIHCYYSASCGCGVNFLYMCIVAMAITHACRNTLNCQNNMSQALVLAYAIMHSLLPESERPGHRHETSERPGHRHETLRGRAILLITVYMHVIWSHGVILTWLEN